VVSGGPVLQRGSRAVSGPRRGSVRLNIREIAAAARLLVQYRLSLEGIQSITAEPGSTAHMEAWKDGGSSRTVDVYGNRSPKPAGGKGRPALAWMLDGKRRSDLIAVADLSTHRVWLFRTSEAFKLAQQHPPGGGHHLIMVTDPGLAHSKHERILDSDFTAYLIQHRAQELFRQGPATSTKEPADG